MTPEEPPDAKRGCPSKKAKQINKNTVAQLYVSEQKIHFKQ